MTSTVPAAALVYGLAVSGEAVVAALVARGARVLVADDTVTDERVARTAELGAEFVGALDDDALASVLSEVEVVVPSPGVPESHRLFGAAATAGVEVVSEIELAYRWEQERPGGPRPILAVTGTDGKTTTTLMAVAILAAAGKRSVAAGNTDVPLVTAIDRDLDVLVVEATSFRLAFTPTFRADAAAWINLAPDHLNWHVDLDSYIRAKEQIFVNQRPDDVAIGYLADPVVMAALDRAVARHVTFGGAGADYRVDGDVLVGPSGPLTTVGDLARPLPHDQRNALAAAALVIETGLATPGDVAAGLATFVGAPHRIEYVGTVDGVAYYNDSKATTPHAAATAIAAFDSLVLIAGGKNKELDLSPMASHPERVRAVVAIGHSADDIEVAFAGVAAAPPIRRASSMAEAVDVAGAAARPGDVVLLSPGCASFDWYRNYEERGDDFRAIVASKESSARPDPSNNPQESTS